MTTKIELPKEEIVEKYKNGKDTLDLGDEYDCSHETIRCRLEEWGIDRRDKTEYLRKEYASLQVNNNGHVVWHLQDVDKTSGIPVHRLHSVAEFGIDAVKDNIVHHVNGIPWDNRVENYELKPRSEHIHDHINLYSDDRD